MPVSPSGIPKRRFMLPFSEIDVSRFKPFTKEMEMAVVLFLAKSNRIKGESQLLRKTDEKIVFIAQAYYPIWLVPYGTAILAFDGLGVTSHVLSYNLTPDIEIFNKDLKRNQKTTEAFTAALFRNADYFNNFQEAQETTIEGMIATRDLKEALGNYLPLMKEMKKSSTTKVVLKPTIGKNETREGVKQLKILRDKIENDVKNIDACMKLLNTATTRRVNAIKEEIKKIRKKQSRTLERTKKTSAKRIQQIQSQYNRKIVRISKKFKKRLLQLNKKQVKLRKASKNLKKEVDRCETKLKRSKRNNRKRIERQWILKLTHLKKKLSKLRKQIKVNTKRIRDAENAQKLEIAKQRIKCCTYIASANMKFRYLQGSKQAEIVMKRQEIMTIEHVSRYITKAMQDTAQRIKLFKAQFDRITLPGRKQLGKLVYIPFYLIRYEKGEMKRYDLHSPSISGDIGIFTKMKGALVSAKVKAMLRPRSEAIEAFLNKLPMLFKEKPMLEKTVTEEGIRNSILLRKNLRSDVNKGLKELRNGKWISQNELEKINRVLYLYSSSIDRLAKTMLIQEVPYQKCISA
jgi:hypothetical protein